jgi:putative methionine-R-sulfoxide reductase with GAF domain
MQTNSTPGAGAKLAREQTLGDLVNASPGPTSQKVHFPGEDGGRSLNEMAQRDLSATLQLLAERAQYITGATGAAIALREGDDIVCRASSGSVAPEIGAHLQVDSGLSGESIRTRQVLRCDDAQTDPRVNRESCEALGIASVVVMPLLREQSVNGVFELLSDRPAAFEERDIGALERLGEMVQTALEHATAASEAAKAKIAAAPEEPVAHEMEKIQAPAVETRVEESIKPWPEEKKPGAELDTAEISIPVDVSATQPTEAKVAEAKAADAKRTEVKAAEIKLADAKGPDVEEEKIADDAPAGHAAAHDSVEETPSTVMEKVAALATKPPKASSKAGLLVGKCSACGFPVSEGRVLCVDCEKKNAGSSEAKPVEAAIAAPLFTMGSDGEGFGSWFAQHRKIVVVIGLVAAAVIAILLLR